MSEIRIFFPRLVQFHRPGKLPWLSGIRTKLAAEGYEYSEPLLLLLSQGLDFYYRSFRPDEGINFSGKNPQLLYGLAAALGIYLRDIYTENVELLRSGIHETLITYWLPCIELPSHCIDRVDELQEIEDLNLLVLGHSKEQQELVVLHPERPEPVRVPFSLLAERCTRASALPLREGRKGLRWFQLVSPSPIRPVYPSLTHSLTAALRCWAHRFLYMPELPVELGLTGLEAFAVCVADLHRVSGLEENGLDTAVADRFLQVSRQQFGPMWGRDLQAQGLREASSLLKIELEGVARAYDQLAERWRELTAMMAAVRAGSGRALTHSVEQFESIAALEKEAAQLLAVAVEQPHLGIG